jgi:serine/threonine protein phosphatase 1
MKFGGYAAVASYGWRGGAPGRPEEVRSLIPSRHIEFVRSCRDYYETVSHFFTHAYYDPDQPLSANYWQGLRWLSLPQAPVPHCSGKTAVVGHTPQKNGDILDLGYVKCIDTFCHGGGWLTALEVDGQRRVWQANEQGEVRN